MRMVESFGGLNFFSNKESARPEYITIIVLMQSLSLTLITTLMEVISFLRQEVNCASLTPATISCFLSILRKARKVNLQ